MRMRWSWQGAVAVVFMSSPRGVPSRRFRSEARSVSLISCCPIASIPESGISAWPQYKSHSLIRHFQRGRSFLSGQFGEFVDLLPAQQRVGEDPSYKGTADTVFQNLEIFWEAHSDFVRNQLSSDWSDKLVWPRK
jgi:glucose-1-phosphate adenylyltransferase